MNKITKFGFEATLATYLYGVPLFENLLSKMNFDTDPEGYVFDHVIDNIKTTIKVAIIKLKEIGNEAYIPKMKASLKSLLEYGTKENSDRMVYFLKQYEESGCQLLPHRSEQDYFCLLENADVQDKVHMLQEILSGVRQIEDPTLN